LVATVGGFWRDGSCRSICFSLGYADFESGKHKKQPESRLIGFQAAFLVSVR